jgi:hypothetical protein
MQNQQSHRTPSFQRATTSCVLAVLCLFLSTLVLQAQTTVLHMKNGDRIAGVILSNDVNSVVISNAWVKQLVVPLNQIASREQVPPAIAAVATQTNAPVAAQTTNAPAVAQTTNAPNSALAGDKSQPAPASASTNAAPAKASTLPPVAKAVPVAKPKRWKGELRVGASFLEAAKDQEIYYGKFRLAYERPYDSNPKKFFRNILDYSADYGKADGILTANRMDGSDKTDFDIGTGRSYIYNLAGVGYDQIRKIDIHYEEGPGVGYHLLTRTNFVLNTEAGFNYQVQDRTDNTTSEYFYLRFAEDVTWKVLKQMTFTEKFEFFPRIADFEQYRMRFESTLSYAVWLNVSLNVSLLDLYDTQPAIGVPNNDFQLRTSLGITF